jgi:hypothetical protein
MTRIRILICALLASLALGSSVVGTGQALASHGQTVYFEAAARLLNVKTRQHTIEQMKALGVKAIRVELYWKDVAPKPNATTRPKFAESKPESYQWGPYKSLLEKAKELHWPVLLTVTAPGPRWATQSTSAPYVKNPNTVEFKEFMTAVGREFGSEVSLWAIWNEANNPTFLQPQFNGNGEPVSPRLYRALFQYGYAGLQAAGLRNPKVLMGETDPTGETSISKARLRSYGVLHDVAPLVFLRGALCLNSHYQMPSTCHFLPAYGFADHAYTLPEGPSYAPPAEDATIGVLSRLVNALNLAARAHAVRSGMPIYITEFGVQSKPNKYFGVTPAKQAEYDAICEKIAYENPRVAAFSQYLLRDDPLGGKPGSIIHGGSVGFQTGLEYVSGQRKPLYAAWPVPLVVTPTGHGYSLWGLVRPATNATRVTILIQRSGSTKWTTLTTVNTGANGYWTLNSTVAGSHWRVRWVSPRHVTYEGPPIGPA